MEEDMIKIAENLGYIVGKHGGKKEVELLNTLINMLKFQEKIIGLMAKDIAHDGFDEDICRAFIQEKRTWECNDDRNCTRCIIEYYEKKAKGE